MSRGPDAGTLLQRALVRDAATAGCVLTPAESHGTRWASATFTGVQHRLTFAATDDAATRAWFGGLAEADVPLRGHLLADLTLVAMTRADGRIDAVVEALTVED